MKLKSLIASVHEKSTYLIIQKQIYKNTDTHCRTLPQLKKQHVRQCRTIPMSLCPIQMRLHIIKSEHVQDEVHYVILLTKPNVLLIIVLFFFFFCLLNVNNNSLQINKLDTQ